MFEAILFILGLSVGSFLNVLIDRLPAGKTIWGRSRCDYCKRELRWFELIPVFSWALQRGKCLRCHNPISLQYPLVELATGIGFVGLYPNVSGMIVFSSLVVIFVADLKYQIIPDSMIFAGVIGVLGVIGGRWEHIVVGAGTALFFFLLWGVTRGRGMGLGDVKLAFLLGLLFGYPTIVVAVYVAFLTGAVIGVILILQKKARLKSKIAFGPFLILGTAVAARWGQHIVAWWRRLV